MKATRRHMLTSGALAALGGGFLSRLDQVAGQQGGSSSSLTDTLKQQASDASLAKLIKPKAEAEGPPQPAYFDRLPLEWNKRTVTRFKKKLTEQDIHAFLVRDRLNIIYLTGYWHTTTERPQSVFMNKDDTDPWYFYPSLDRDIVRSWWFGGGRMYFDFLHGDGAFPHEGSVQQGKTVDLFEFMLEGLKEHGIEGTKIGIDGELYPSEIAKALKILPKIEFVDISETLIGMRQVKTDEELALWRRAYVYFDRAHCFARDYILTHGTDSSHSSSSPAC